ncbi:MAG: response regulator [bacterium]|jgi:DNA-binding response OmpR family regulator|nr:response regulator [bacterium]
MAKRILVVEDEPDIAEVVKQRLTGAGFEVMIAEDGYMGLETARRERPDLIILDLMLPKIEGYKVCRMLKFDQEYSHIPIVILTARSQPVEEEIGYSTGANLYLTKPFDGNELVNKVKELLNIGNQEK